MEEYNADRKRKVFIVFDDMIANIISNKKHNQIVTEIFIRERKVNISTVFISKSYFTVPKDVRLISTHIFIIKIPNKLELQQIAFDHSSDIAFNDFMNIYKNYIAKLHAFLLNNSTLQIILYFLDVIFQKENKN